MLTVDKSKESSHRQIRLYFENVKNMFGHCNFIATILKITVILKKCVYFSNSYLNVFQGQYETLSYDDVTVSKVLDALLKTRNLY